MRLQSAVVKKKNKARIGTEYDVLIENPVKGRSRLWQGRTSFQAPEVDSIIECNGAACEGQFARVRVKSVRGLNLVGEIL